MSISYEASDDAVTVDDELHGSGQETPGIGDVGRLELVVVLEDGLELSVDLMELVRLDVDEGHGWRVAIGLKLSSVGPHCLLVQNFGVAKTSMIGLCAANASATEVW